MNAREFKPPVAGGCLSAVIRAGVYLSALCGIAYALSLVVGDFLSFGWIVLAMLIAFFFGPIICFRLVFVLDARKLQKQLDEELRRTLAKVGLESRREKRELEEQMEERDRR